MSDIKGLGTKEALQRLHDDIQAVLIDFNKSNKKRKRKQFIKDAMHHGSPYTTFHWISATMVFFTAITLIALYIFTNVNEYLFGGIILLCFNLFNLYLVLKENHLRHHEIPKKVTALLATLKLAIRNVKWDSDNYPHLCTPFSPCVTLQWVYRDGTVVNLPWALLVKDDVIVMRPGQLSPGICESLEHDSDYFTLRQREIYGPALPDANEMLATPKLKVPLKNKLYILKETPFLNNLQIVLDKDLSRPVSLFDQERHFLFNICQVLFAYPCFLVLASLFNVVKIAYLPFSLATEWLDLFVAQPLLAALPMLPIMLPLFWIILNFLGLAKFKSFFNNTSKVPMLSGSEHFTEPESLNEAEIHFKYKLSEVWNIFLDMILGNDLMMIRSTNILHVFSHLSALCVVDKKGILSWPNPTAEKIFFFKNAADVSQSSSLESMNDSTADLSKPSQNQKDSAIEVLDMTHNQNLPFKVEFDDHAWKKHLSSLKPIGLSILLNTCNMETQQNYNTFCAHITCEAMYNEHLVPVANRRCLCELPKQIGFVDGAKSIFALEEQLSTFRHLHSDLVRKDKLVKALHLMTKLKFPFPHMVAVLVKELNSDAHQLFSQGTADIILDSCSDYWNGNNLFALTSSERKKITDFYSRTSLTAYCTAFAYRPLNKTVDNKLSQGYLELPSNTKAFMAYRSPTPMHWEVKKGAGDTRSKGIVSNFHSTDSLLYYDNKEETVTDVGGCFEMQCNQVFLGMVTMQYQAQTDMVHLIERLERACIRFVHFSKENELRSRVFSEKMGLESGWNCHISLLPDKSHISECWANNGTTRVWSPSLFPAKVINRRETQEKIHNEETAKILTIGSNLESSKAMSISAPSAINLDCTVVKFDEEAIIECELNEPSDNVHINNDLEESEKDSVMAQSLDLSSHQDGWPSLSCLTDSTEQSAPVNFDMSNRAKLPKGIENIRPHLEKIDNVPLLVSLFTDCTPAVTVEMLHIMQEYGQSVCVLGSVANADNSEVFMQADVSIAVEPLYPQLCQQIPVFIPCNPVYGPSPIGLSRSLNSLPCSLTFRREDPVSIFHLIFEARHYMSMAWNCVQFWLCCVATLSILQLTAMAFLLPPLFNISELLWLECVIIPLLSISFLGNKRDLSVMKKPAQKLLCGTSMDTIIFVIWTYGGKFIPIIVFSTILYRSCLISCCENIVKGNVTCELVYPVLNNDINLANFEPYLIYSQHITIFMVVFLLCTLSIGFVFRESLTWKKNPIQNILWISLITIILILQIIYTIVNVLTINDVQHTVSIWDLPWYIISLIFLAPPVTFVIAEIIKWQEIQVNLRYLRRARIEFGTKLGMNSPF